MMLDIVQKFTVCIEIRLSIVSRAFIPSSAVHICSFSLPSLSGPLAPTAVNQSQ